MRYEEWVAALPHTITEDSLWNVKAYQLALFAGDIGWQDVTKLAQERRTVGVCDQLYRALGSISANIAEGYGRSTGRDRARFYAFALGSARESRDWYFKGRYVLGSPVTEHRLNLLTQIIRLLITMIPEQRSRLQVLQEPLTGYQLDSETSQFNGTSYLLTLDDLLNVVPMS